MHVHLLNGYVGINYLAHVGWAETTAMRGFVEIRVGEDP